MSVANTLRTALRGITANKLRAFLTMLGVIIGVASVVVMLAIGNGAKQNVLDQISSMGTNLLLIRPGAPNIRHEGAMTATLVPEDAEAIAEIPNVAEAVPEFPTQVTVRYGNVDYVTTADSTTAGFERARDWYPTQGVFFSAADVKSYAPVVTLGQTVARALFASGVDPVGKYILINNIPFQVIGLMSPRGATPYGADMDDVVLTPYTTGSLRLFGQHYVKSITVQVDDVDRIDETQTAIRSLLLARHRVHEGRDQVGDGVARRDLHLRRIAQDGRRQLADLVREGRREHQVLSRLGQQRDDAPGPRSSAKTRQARGRAAVGNASGHEKTGPQKRLSARGRSERRILEPGVTATGHVHCKRGVGVVHSQRPSDPPSPCS